jgi:hypothetical protein
MTAQPGTGVRFELGNGSCRELSQPLWPRLQTRIGRDQVEEAAPRWRGICGSDTPQAAGPRKTASQGTRVPAGPWRDPQVNSSGSRWLRGME